MQKYRERNGRRIAIRFKSIGVRGRFDSPGLNGEQKKEEKKQHRQNLHGIVPGFWGDILFMGFFSPIRKDPPRKRINKKTLPPSKSWDHPPKVVYVYVHLFPDINHEYSFFFI